MISFLALVAAILPIALCDPMFNGNNPQSSNRSFRLFGANVDVTTPQQHYEPPVQDHYQGAGTSHPRLFGATLDPFANLSMHSHSSGGAGAMQESYHDEHYPGHQMYEATPNGDPMSTEHGHPYNPDQDMGYFDYQSGQYHPDMGYQEGDEHLEGIDEDEEEEEENDLGTGTATGTGTGTGTGEGLEGGEVPTNEDGTYDFNDIYNNYTLADVLNKGIVLTEFQLRLLMEKFFPVLHFNVIDPYTSLTEPVSVAKGHGILHIIGGGETWKIFAMDIERRFPGGKRMTKEQRFAKTAAEQALKRCRSAMAHLCRDPRAGVFHEPSGMIFMSPLASANDGDLIKELTNKLFAGQLPKLRMSDMIHFKTSNEVKMLHRNAPVGRREKGKGVMQSKNGKTMQDETSSQGDTDMGEANMAPPPAPQEDGQGEYQNDFSAMEQAVTRKARTKKTRSVQNL